MEWGMVQHAPLPRKNEALGTQVPEKKSPGV